MNFTFTEEQRLLEDTVQRFVARDYAFEMRGGIVNSPAGWSREVWGTFAELGLLALNVPEAHGGLDGGPVENMLVMEALGRGLVVEPYLPSAVHATWLVRLAADDAQQAEILPALAAGESIAAVAHAEPGARHEIAHVETRARRTADGYRLDGRKAVVAGGGGADTLLVSARTAGGADDRAGVSLFRIPHDASGVTLREYPTIDDRRAADLWLRDAAVPASARLGVEGEALAAVEDAQHVALAAVCAEAVGAMKALLDATVEYLRTRRQFGQPLGQFQALRHRAVEMLMYHEQARSMSYLAAMRCTHADRDERRRALSAAKVAIGRASRFVGQQAVQLHGGMGMTEELDVGHYFKRLTAIELSMGDTGWHLGQFIATLRADR